MKSGKKYFIFILVMMLVVAMAFTLTCCNKNDKKAHDPSGGQQSQEEEETKIDVTIDDDFDASEDGTLSCSVPNATDKFSLDGKFFVSRNVTVKFYYSPDGVTLGDEIKNKEAVLNEGENYIIVILTEGENSNSYLIVIYRQKHYTVSFESSAPEIPSQAVLDGECAVAPTQIPTRIGCTFDKWDFDFSTPITSDVTIKPLWKPNQYTITYDPDGGEMDQTTQTVIYGEDVTFLVPTKNGYQFKGWFIGGSKQKEGVWTRTTDVEFLAKWEIDYLEVTIAPSLQSAGEIKIEGGNSKFEYDDECTVSANENKGYRFGGWYDVNDQLVSSEKSYKFVVKDNVRLTAKFSTYKPEMAPYYFFTADEESYIISGVRDQRVESLTIPDCVVAIQENAFDVTNLKSLTIPFIGTCADCAKKASSLQSMFRFSIPKTLRSVHVTGECYVNSSTFSNANYIETLTLDNVKSIGDRSFASIQYLVNFTITDSVEYVGSDIFFTLSNATLPKYIKLTEYNNAYYFGTSTNPYCICVKLKDNTVSTFTAHSDTKIIAAGAFRGTVERPGGDLNVVLPEGLIAIGDSAFYNCKLASVNFPSTLKYIGGYAFGYSLVNGTIDLSFGNVLETIGESAFAYSTAINSVVLPDSLTSLGQSAFYNCTNLGTLSIGSGLTAIANSVFNKTNISSVTIPDNIESIGENAFGGCDIETLVIGKGLRYIEDNAFESKKNLSSITISADNEYFYGTGCVVDFENDNLIIGSSSAVLPEGLKSIGNYAFKYSSITALTIPSTVTYIGKYALYMCTSLSKTSLSVPDSVEYVGEYAFYGVVYARIIENNVYYMGNDENNYAVAYALVDYNCMSVVFNDNVKCVADNNIFNSCSNIESITCPDGAVFAPSLVKNNNLSNLNNTVDGVIYRGTSSNPYLYVVGCDGASSSYEIKSGAVEIGAMAFMSKRNLTSIIIPNTVKVIGESAFYCSGLTSVTIPDSVEEIGRYAFYNYEAQTSVTLGSGVKSIGECAFVYCKFTSLTLPNTLEYIGENAFSSCKGIKSIAVPGTVKLVNSSAFYSNSELTTVIFKTGVEEIGISALSNCTKVTEITIPASVKRIDNNAFYHLSNLTDVNFSGTIAQWLHIEKENHWQYYAGTFTVHCDDGDLTYYGSYN